VLTGLPNYPEGRIYSGYSIWRRRDEEYRGAKVTRCALIPRGRGGGVRLFINYLSFAVSACVAALSRIKGKYDVVFVYEVSPVTVAIPALVFKRFKRVPVLMWVQDLWPESVIDAGNMRSRPVLWILKKLVKWIYVKTDRLLLSSQAFKESVQSFGVPEQKVSYLPNWAEDYFRPCSRNTPFENEELLPVGFKVVFAGNIGEAQDFPAIIDAADRLRDMKDIKWIILGSGRYSEWAREEVDKRGLNDTVHFVGRFAPEMMPSFFCRADVMLVSLRKSLIFSLTVPAKLQTYMACGRPIVTMLDGEGSRIVKEAKAGLVCGAGDSERLAGNVLDMFNMPAQQREEMGENALAYCRRHFNRERLLSDLEQTLVEVAEEYQTNYCLA